MTSAEPAAVSAGLRRQREVLEEQVAAGEHHCGWKVGFGSAAGLVALGLDGPIIGHLLASGEVADGSVQVVTGWTRPVIEAEIACWIAKEVPAELDPADADHFVGGVGPALEVADVDHAPEDPERILAGNIFHRGYVLGRPDPRLTLTGAAALSARFRHGEEELYVTEPEELTGLLPQVLARAAHLAPELGRPVLAGDVILLGSIISPRPVRSGERVEYTLAGFPPLSLSFR